MALFLVLDDQNLEHPRQAQEGRRRKTRQGQPAVGLDLPIPQARGIDPRQRFRNAAADAPDYEDPHGHQRHQLDHCLDRDGHDDPVVAFVCVQVPGAEKHGEKGQARRHPEGRRILVGQRTHRRVGQRKACNRKGYGLKLQGNVRRGANHGEQSYQNT